MFTGAHKLNFTANQKISWVEKFLRKGAPDESITDIHSYLMEYLSRLEGNSKNPKDDIEINTTILVNNRREILDDIKNYGAVALPVVYSHYTKLYKVKDLMESSIGGIVRQLNTMYLKYGTQISIINFGFDFDECYYDMQIEEQFGKEYTMDFITLLFMIIAFDIDNRVGIGQINYSLENISHGLEDTTIEKQLKAHYKLSIRSISHIIGDISPSILFRTLNYKFDDKAWWPYQDNLVDLLKNRLDKFDFNKNTLRKLRMIDCDRYKGIDIGSSLHIMILKDIINSIK